MMANNEYLLPISGIRSWVTPSSDKGRIVFGQDKNVALYETASGTERTIEEGSASNDALKVGYKIEENPLISGDWIVWDERLVASVDESGKANFTRTIYAYNLLSKKKIKISEPQVDSDNRPFFKISGKKVVWSAYEANKFQVYMYDLVTGQKKKLAESFYKIGCPDINQNKIVWTEMINDIPSIVLYDLNTSTKTYLSSQYYFLVQQPVVSSSGGVVWSGTNDAGKAGVFYNNSPLAGTGNVGMGNVGICGNCGIN